MDVHPVGISESRLFSTWNEIRLYQSKYKRNILPRCAISKRLRYEKQIKALHLFRLLSLEMLHRRVETEK